MWRILGLLSAPFFLAFIFYFFLNDEETNKKANEKSGCFGFMALIGLLIVLFIILKECK